MSFCIQNILRKLKSSSTPQPPDPDWTGNFIPFGIARKPSSPVAGCGECLGAARPILWSGSALATHQGRAQFIQKGQSASVTLPKCHLSKGHFGKRWCRCVRVAI